MTKTIKFNLNADGKPVRTLDELRESCNIDDLLRHYESGVLARWLEVRGFNEELEKIKAIKAEDDILIVSEMCKIFHADISEEKMKSDVYPLVFRKREKKDLEKYQNNKSNKADIISDYHKDYGLLLKEIESSPANYAFLKATVNVLWDNYNALLKVDFVRFFSFFSAKAPLLFFTMLANDKYRQPSFFSDDQKEKVFNLLPQQFREKDTIKIEKDTNRSWIKLTDNQVIIKSIKNASSSVQIKGTDNKEWAATLVRVDSTLLGLSFSSNAPSDSIEYAEIEKVELDPPYKTFSGNTEGHWHDVEPKGKKFLILKIEKGNLICNADVRGEEFKDVDVNGKFLILDGINYKSNNADNQLIYLEV